LARAARFADDGEEIAAICGKAEKSFISRDLPSPAQAQKGWINRFPSADVSANSCLRLKEAGLCGHPRNARAKLRQ
jgi:hypothetical protein